MKKLNSKGFTHHLLIFALLALVVSAAGFAGYRVWKNKNIDAQATNWRYVVGNANGTIYACQTEISSKRFVKVKVVSKSRSLSGWAYAVNNNVFTKIIDVTGANSVKPYSHKISKLVATPKTDSAILLLDMGTGAGAADILYSEKVRTKNLRTC